MSARPRSATPARPVAEERKVVTALFCDLVGFTATSESADPEDVDRMLAAYFAMARGRRSSATAGWSRSSSGTPWSASSGCPPRTRTIPSARYARACGSPRMPRSSTSVGGAPLRLRVGINTGEALVRLGVARRLGGGVPRRRRDQHRLADPVGRPRDGGRGWARDLRGHRSGLRLRGARARHAQGQVRAGPGLPRQGPRGRGFGTDLTRIHDTPFIGREIDLALLKGIFDKTLAANAPQLVTVVGEPGLGQVPDRGRARGLRRQPSPSSITWRQGRCLPYGEGITFWALGEILKAHAGILESDHAAVAERQARGRAARGTRARVVPPAPAAAAGDRGAAPRAEREELFTAWRRFLEHIAERDPTVLVFEDLHWADERDARVPRTPRRPSRRRCRC